MGSLKAKLLRQAKIALDGLSWVLAVFAATAARYDFALRKVDLGGLVLMGTLALIVQVASGFVSGLYRGRWRFGSFDEVLGLVRASAITSLTLFLLDLLKRPRLIPLSATLSGGFIALVLMAGSRFMWRLLLERMRRPTGEDAARLLIFGAGEGGAQVVTAALRDPASRYIPVALLDDDHHKRHLRIMGVPVVGGRMAIGEAAKKYRADALLIAIPSAGSELVAELTDIARQAGLRAMVLPPVSELFGAAVGIGDIRAVTELDLLGRHQVETDIGSIAGYITGKRVMVTGAGGSIGSELCRQLYRFAPSELIMLDRDESGLQAVQFSIEGRSLLDSDSLVLGNIRDAALVRDVFERHQPDVVFHAAALKHLPLLERHVAEAYKVNVLGTLNVLDAALSVGVERFVNISTDKAADPCSVLGYTKRITERLTAHYAAKGRGTFISVRFGNVLGTNGSMLGIFRAQIENGGPVTVTHPEVTRYFMTVEEAVQLVIQAGAIGRDGETLVLDMGTPVRIVDVVERLVAQADRHVEIVYTGLRSGEKLHETLIGAHEKANRPVHPLISHVSVPPLDPHDAISVDLESEADEMKGTLKRLSGADPVQPTQQLSL